MLSMAFVQAYYIPFLPYMIFTFGSIAWLTVVVEAMIAGPIVALGVAHPEGNDAFGKGEAALMILLNVFLRPVLMIIGYIAAIALSYVSVWVINAGFQTVLNQLLGTNSTQGLWAKDPMAGSPYGAQIGMVIGFLNLGIPWGVIFGFFSASILFTTLYMTVVEKSFALIATLPDTILRWIGGSPEHAGSDTLQWSDAAKQAIKEGGKDISTAAVSALKKPVAGIQGAIAEGIGGKGKENDNNEKPDDVNGKT
jgi:defect-in-organelle-trafficking protein DotA